MKKILVATFLLVLTTNQVFAQGMPQLPITNVMVTVKANEGAREHPDFASLLPNEVRETMKRYLSGKIAQWYSRADGNGVIFIMNATSVEDAKSTIQSLPFAKNGLVTDEYVALTPMAPMGMLVAQP